MKEVLLGIVTASVVAFLVGCGGDDGGTNDAAQIDNSRFFGTFSGTMRYQYSGVSSPYTTPVTLTVGSNQGMLGVEGYVYVPPHTDQEAFDTIYGSYGMSHVVVSVSANTVATRIAPYNETWSRQEICIFASDYNSISYTPPHTALMSDIECVLTRR
jgi:hypothetical protein